MREPRGTKTSSLRARALFEKQQGEREKEREKERKKERKKEKEETREERRTHQLTETNERTLLLSKRLCYANCPLKRFHKN